MTTTMKPRTGSFGNVPNDVNQQQQQQHTSPTLTIIPTTTSTTSSNSSSSTATLLTPTTPHHNNNFHKMTTASCPGASLYHTCRIVLDKLALVPGMTPWLVLENDSLSPSLTPMNTATTTITTTSTIATNSLNIDIKNINDPLTKLCIICRRGIPLSILFNALNTNMPLKIDTNPSLNQINSCKASVYHFLVACRNQLLFSEEELFAISDLYIDDTNGFVKVVNTVNRILNLLEDRGIISLKSSSNRDSNPIVPKNMRDQVILELLSTERKYVQDLETLQNYMRELQQQKILSPDTVHYLFGNLNSLVDFQRRFLMEMEKIAENEQPQQQKFGYLFSSMEQAFSVYEPYCSNYHSAQDLVAQEAPNLQKLNDMVNPTHVLTSLLIKPVQRICKYPLLINELLKTTIAIYHKNDQQDKDNDDNDDDNDDKEKEDEEESDGDDDIENKEENDDDDEKEDVESIINDLNEGLESIKRVTEKVNETQRRQENLQIVDQLKRHVDGWKGVSIDHCGQLLLQDKVNFTVNNASREMHIFYFENRLIFCKEPKENRLAKTNTISIMKKRRGTLEPKGTIDTHLITTIRNISENGEFILYFEWRDNENRQFSLKFRNEEQCKLWETTLYKQLNQHNNNDNMDDNNYMNNQFMSTLTLTPDTSNSDNRSFIDADDEEDEIEYTEDDLVENNNSNHRNISRSNSISAQFKNTFINRSKQRRDSNSNEDHHHHQQHHGILKTNHHHHHHHGRANTPGMNLQPLPRTASSSTSTAYTQSPPLTAASTSTDYSFYPSSPPPSNPSSPTGMSRVSPNNSQSGRPFRDFQQMQQSADYFIQNIDNATKQGNYHHHHTMISPTITATNTTATNSNTSNRLQHPILPQSRTRAQSSPSIQHNNHQQLQQSSTSSSYLLDKSIKSSSATRMLKKERSSSMQAQVDHYQYYHQQHQQQQQQQQQQQLQHQHHPNNNNNNNAHYNNISVSSSSSAGQVNIKIVYEDRKHNITIPQQTSYEDLLEIVKKILHGYFGTETTPNDHIRLKYKDEDGDFITVNSNDDIQMAIESCWSRNIKLFVSL